MRILPKLLLMTAGVALSASVMAAAAPSSGAYKLHIASPGPGGRDVTPFQLVYCGEPNGAACSAELQQAINNDLQRIRYNTDYNDPSTTIYIPKQDRWNNNEDISALTIGNNQTGTEAQHYCRFTIAEDGTFANDRSGQMRFNCGVTNYDDGANLLFHYAN